MHISLYLPTVVLLNNLAIFTAFITTYKTLFQEKTQAKKLLDLF